MKHFFLFSFALIDDEDLLSNHREHFDIDTIEFVETTPGAAPCQPFEKLGHGEIIQPIRAIEHHAMDGDGLREIFDCLGFAGACGTLGRTCGGVVGVD